MMGQYALREASTDLSLDCALAVCLSNLSGPLKREIKRMEASVLRFMKQRSTLEYQRYRKDLLSSDC